jgi:hypothetical protein
MKDFREQQPRVYEYIRIRGWLDKFTKHMFRDKKRYHLESDEELLNMAQGFKNINDMRLQNYPLWNYLNNRNLLSKVYFYGDDENLKRINHIIELLKKGIIHKEIKDIVGCSLSYVYKIQYKYLDKH